MARWRGGGLDRGVKDPETRGGGGGREMREGERGKRKGEMGVGDRMVARWRRAGGGAWIEVSSGQKHGGQWGRDDGERGEGGGDGGGDRMVARTEKGEGGLG